jgi:hypothetical protein
LSCWTESLSKEQWWPTSLKPESPRSKSCMVKAIIGDPPRGQGRQNMERKEFHLFCER